MHDYETVVAMFQFMHQGIFESATVGICVEMFKRFLSTTIMLLWERCNYLLVLLESE